MKPRIQSIDFLRGAVMVLMAIDHVRVYSGIPAGGQTATIFFTRWITHYCAPAFVFFAGTGAFLYLQKTSDTALVGRFLLIRGLLLVVLELTVIRFFWTFNLDYVNFTFAGVIWMLGWCMVILAACIRLRPATLLVIGLILIATQQLFSQVPLLFPESTEVVLRPVWDVFYPTSVPAKGGAALSGTSGFPRILGINIFYVLIPWIGVMMAGFGFGQLFSLSYEKRKKICLSVGLAAIIVFIIAGSTVSLTTHYHAEVPFLFRLLGQQKYPPSQLYLLMTLGPLIAFVPWAETVKGKIADAVSMIGRVPMFFYMTHLLLIHLSAWAVNFIRDGSIHQEWYNSAPFVGLEPDQQWSLQVLYLVWMADVIILYFACRWYADFKQKNYEIRWLKYI